MPKKKNETSCIIRAIEKEHEAKNNWVAQVDRDVPMPLHISKGAFKPVLASMETGDSFFVPKTKRRSIATQVSIYGQALGKKFTIRKEGKDYRCWRVE